MRNQLSWGLACTAAAMASGVALADTAGSTLAVSATVLKACVATAGTVAFGNYNPAATSDKTGSGTFTVVCTVGTGYTLGLDEGAGSGASTTTRKMTFSGNTLDYTLYKESALTNIWGDAGGALVSATGDGLVQTYTVYGVIPKEQAVAPGAYADTVDVVVTY